MQDMMNRRISRRRLMQIGGITVLSLVIEACGRVVASSPGSQAAPTGAAAPTLAAGPGSAPPVAGVNAGKGAPPATPAKPGEILVTPNSDFYTVAYNSVAPDFPSDWKLKIAGNLDKPMTLTLDDIKAMPVVEEMRTFECISNPAGGPLISNAMWKGIKMKDLLTRVGVKPSTIEIKLESFDGYSTAIPLDLAMNEHSLLAYEMNGEPLPIEHGKPLRCMWPGRYGMKQPKWLTTITAITDKYLGYWEQQGWSDEARVLPTSRVDFPAENGSVKGPSFDMAGVGFSGEEGIDKIEVSWDDGKTWHAATLVRGPTPYVWTNWSLKGATPPAGEASLLARVTDNAGRVQTREGVSLLGDTFPNGTSAMHAVVVNVTG
jgi:DMSO/TMAO reductase YedYZ molybdopterin-dependent catalytic subunit